MSKSTRSRNSIFAYPFWLTTAIAILVYLLRGFGVLSFMPGGILLIIMGLAFLLAILYVIDKNRRF